MKTHLPDDWQNADKLDDDDLDIFDLPAITPSFFENDRARQPQQRIQVPLQVEQDVLAWFRAQGPGWEKSMTLVLREYVDVHRGNAPGSQPEE